MFKESINITEIRDGIACLRLFAILDLHKFNIFLNSRSNAKDILRILPNELNGSKLNYKYLAKDDIWEAYYDGEYEEKSTRHSRTLLGALYYVLVWKLLNIDDFK